MAKMSDSPAQALSREGGCGWKCAISQMDLAYWRGACLMRGVLSMEELMPISVLQSVPVSSSNAARVPKKLHLFSAGQQKGTKFLQRYKWRVHVMRQQALQAKVTFPYFIPPSVDFPRLPLTEIRNTESFRSHYPNRARYRWMFCFWWRPNLWVWRQRIKSSPFISCLLSFSIWSVC